MRSLVKVEIFLSKRQTINGAALECRRKNMSGNFGDIFKAFFTIGLVLGLLIFGLYLLVDNFFIDHAIKVKKPIKPTIELVVKNNVVDTVYVYRKP